LLSPSLCCPAASRAKAKAEALARKAKKALADQAKKIRDAVRAARKEERAKAKRDSEKRRAQRRARWLAHKAKLAKQKKFGKKGAKKTKQQKKAAKKEKLKKLSPDARKAYLAKKAAQKARDAKEVERLARLAAKKDARKKREAALAEKHKFTLKKQSQPWHAVVKVKGDAPKAKAEKSEAQKDAEKAAIAAAHTNLVKSQAEAKEAAKTKLQQYFDSIRDPELAKENVIAELMPAVPSQFKFRVQGKDGSVSEPQVIHRNAPVARKAGKIQAKKAAL
jgi:hypothetical protein